MTTASSPVRTTTLQAAAAPGHARLRRARCLVCYWADDGTVLIGHPYPDGTPVALPGDAIDVLAAFEEWSSPHDAVSHLAERHEEPAVLEAVRFLADHALLVSEGSRRALRDADIGRHWGPWAPQAPFLHYTTDFTPHDTPTGPRAAPTASTPLFTSYPDADRVLLPRHPADLDARFGQVLHQRRTTYSFSPEPLPLPALAALLHTVFAPVDFIDTGPSGARYRRTSPSAGACQELEAYLAAVNVHGLAPGWYHYNAIEHSLELLAQGCTGEEVTDLCAGQQHAGRAAFLLVLTSVIGRLNDHRATARSYRVGLLNAGHLGQTFVLTATALGLGSMQLSACHDGALAERFGLDAVTHVPVHVLGAGLSDHTAEPIASPAGLDAFRRTALA